MSCPCELELKNIAICKFRNFTAATFVYGKLLGFWNVCVDILGLSDSGEYSSPYCGNVLLRSGQQVVADVNLLPGRF